jgi:hypothetical protein
MGGRKEYRVKSVLPARVYGTDSDGKSYSILAHTLDFSRTGARLGGIVRPLQVGETITLDYKHRRAQFVVRWVGLPGTPSDRQVGVESLQPEKLLWLEVPEEDYTDDVEVSRRRASVATSEAQSTASSITPAADSDAKAGPLAVEDAMPTGTLVESLFSIVDRVGDAQRGEEGDTQSPSGVVAAIGERITAEAVPLDAALELIAASAQRLLNGSGAAIALPDNDELVCRASAGRAPKIGVRFRADAGLAREVVTKGCIVTCDNTLRDPRVNADIWQKVGIGSAISAPIILSQGTTAILEVFAARSNAFSVAHAALLQELTDLVRRVVA